MNEPESLPQPLPPDAAKHPRSSLGLGIALLMVLLALALQVAFCICTGVIVAVINRGKLVDSQLAAAVAVGNVLCLSAVIWLGVQRSKLPWHKVIALTGFHPLLLGPMVPVALGLGILSSEAENLMRALGLEPEFFREQSRHMHQGGVWAMIALLLVAPITEELLFRGVILTGFLRRYGIVRSVLYSAILFGVIHLNPVQVTAASMGGLILGWLFVRTRSLWPCIILHAIYNAEQSVVPYLCQQWHIRIRGFTGSATPGLVEFQPAWFDVLAVVLIMLGVCGIILLTRRAAGETDTWASADGLPEEPIELVEVDVQPPV